jgi:putative tricarboxylic transport membrane protein
MLAVMSENRLKSFPEIPTAREQGVDLVFPRWRGLYMAADVPAEAVEYWSTTIRKMAGTPQWNDELTKLGWEPVTRFGEEFSRYLNSELQLYREVFKELGFIR